MARHTHRPLPVGTSDCYIQMNLTGDLDPMFITFGMQFTNAPTTATATSLMTAFNAHIMPTQNSAYQGVKAHILFQSDAEHQLAFDSTNAIVAGSSTDIPAPQNVAYLVKKSTGFAGRRFRGRFYVPGVSEANVTPAGVLSGGLLTGLESAWDSFFTNITALGSMVLIHSTEYEDPNPPVTPPLPTRVLSLTVDPVVATQRRRLRR